MSVTVELMFRFMSDVQIIALSVGQLLVDVNSTSTLTPIILLLPGLKFEKFVHIILPCELLCVYLQAIHSCI